MVVMWVLSSRSNPSEGRETERSLSDCRGAGDRAIWEGIPEEYLYTLLYSGNLVSAHRVGLVVSIV